MGTHTPHIDGPRERALHDANIDATVEWRSPAELVVTIKPEDLDLLVEAASDEHECYHGGCYSHAEVKAAESDSYQEGHNAGRLEALADIRKLAAGAA